MKYVAVLALSVALLVGCGGSIVEAPTAPAPQAAPTDVPPTEILAVIAADTPTDAQATKVQAVQATRAPQLTATKAATNTPLPSATATITPTATRLPTAKPTAQPVATAKPAPKPTAVPKPTPAPAPRATNTPAPAAKSFDNNGDGKVTCADFKTQAEAKVALAAGYTKLDNDGDGIPCESLPAG